MSDLDRIEPLTGGNPSPTTHLRVVESQLVPRGLVFSEGCGGWRSSRGYPIGAQGAGGRL